MERDRRWHNATVFGSRVEFVPGRRPAVLTLRDLRPADQSLYKCRVDFQHSRTRNVLVNLTVIGKSGDLTCHGNILSLSSRRWGHLVRMANVSDGDSGSLAVKLPYVTVNCRSQKHSEAFRKNFIFCFFVWNKFL